MPKTYSQCTSNVASKLRKTSAMSVTLPFHFGLHRHVAALLNSCLNKQNQLRRPPSWLFGYFCFQWQHHVLSQESYCCFDHMLPMKLNRAASLKHGFHYSKATRVSRWCRSIWEQGDRLHLQQQELWVCTGRLTRALAASSQLTSPCHHNLTISCIVCFRVVNTPKNTVITVNAGPTTRKRTE